jgi:DNA replication protein DnaC
VPFDFREADLDIADPTLAVECLDWISELTDTPVNLHGPGTVGQNLVFIGSPGAGKTWAAFATCKELRWVGHDRPHLAACIGLPTDAPGVWVRGSNFRYWTTGSLLAQLRADETRTWALLRSAPVLFLDDIGSMRSTEWVLDQLYLVLDDFRSQGKPVIATTNLTLSDLEVYLGAAAYSRLMGKAVVLHIRDSDRRKG